MGGRTKFDGENTNVDNIRQLKYEPRGKVVPVTNGAGVSLSIRSKLFGYVVRPFYGVLVFRKIAI